MHLINLSVRLLFVFVCCSKVGFRNCYCAFLSVFLNRFCFLLWPRLYIEFHLTMITNVTFISLDSMTFSYLIHVSTKSLERGISSAVEPYCVNKPDKWVCPTIIRKCERLKQFKEKKRKNFYFTWCRKWNADFLFLQETHSTVENGMSWRHEWGAEIISANGNSWCPWGSSSF